MPLALILPRGDQWYLLRKPLIRRDKGDTLSLLVQFLLKLRVPSAPPPASLLISTIFELAATGPTLPFLHLFLVCMYIYSIAHNRAIRPCHPSHSMPLALILPRGDRWYLLRKPLIRRDRCMYVCIVACLFTTSVLLLHMVFFYFFIFI